jgi:hypothetical protein
MNMSLKKMWRAEVLIYIQHRYEIFTPGNAPRWTLETRGNPRSYAGPDTVRFQTPLAALGFVGVGASVPWYSVQARYEPEPSNL